MDPIRSYQLGNLALAVAITSITALLVISAASSCAQPAAAGCRVEATR